MDMTQQFTFVCFVGKQEWPALPKDFEEGEKVQRFLGHDYGCCRDDMVYGGHETIACSLDGNPPFFTVPVKWLRDDDNKQPMGEYIRIDRSAGLVKGDKR